MRSIKILTIFYTIAVASSIYWAWRVKLDASNWLALIGIWVFGAILMFEIFNWIYKGRDEKLRLSRLLADDVLSKWDLGIYGSGSIGSCKIKYGRLIITKPSYPFFRFTAETIKILKSGKFFYGNPNYPRLFDNDGKFLWDKIIDESSKELKRIEGVWNRFQEIVSKQIVELDLPLVLDAVYSEVNEYLVRKHWYARPLEIRQEGKMFRLIWSRNCLAESTKEADLKDLGTRIEGLMDDEEISKLVGTMQMKAEEKENIEKLKKRFMDELYSIIKDVDLGNPLRGI